jgi:hypothetical protein
MVGIVVEPDARAEQDWCDVQVDLVDQAELEELTSDAGRENLDVLAPAASSAMRTASSTGQLRMVTPSDWRASSRWWVRTKMGPPTRHRTVASHRSRCRSQPTATPAGRTPGGLRRRGARRGTLGAERHSLHGPGSELVLWPVPATPAGIPLPPGQKASRPEVLLVFARDAPGGCLPSACPAQSAPRPDSFAPRRPAPPPGAESTAGAALLRERLTA